MKLAVLLFGDYREFEKASISYDFFDEYDIDFYISTWKYTTSYDSEYNSTKKEITKQIFYDLLPKSPKFLCISDEEYFENLDYTQKMIRHWKILADALRQNTESDYTAILLIRIDFYITYLNETKLKHEGKSGNLHINGGMTIQDGGHWVSDISHTGNTEVILNYIDMLPLYPALQCHSDFGNLLYESNIKVDNQESIHGMLLRPTTSSLLSNDHIVNLTTLNDNIDKISELHEIFSQWHHNYSYGSRPGKTFREYLLEYKRPANQ